VGADFEYQTGLYRCQDCAWSDAEPERVAQCLGCGLRFPEHQAELLDLPEYDADRLDPLAFAKAS
jgi:hypothetical protein